MILHHIGYLVDSIEKGIQDYSPLLQNGTAVSEIFNIEAQNVKVCFLPLARNIFMELVEPLEGNKALLKMRKKGIGFYHLGYMVEDIQRSILDFEESNYFLVSIFNSPAFDGRQCAFLLSPDRQLIELIQTSGG